MALRLRFVIAGSLLAGLLMLPSVAIQAAPQINNLSVRGLQIGGSTTLAIDGAELLPEPKLFLGAVPVAFKLKDGAQPNRIEVEIALDASQEASLSGVQQLRIGSASGISNGVLVGVNRLPQLPFGPAATQLPAAYHGELSGSTVLSTQFEGRQGQQIVIDLSSRRLGSAMTPVVRLLDSRRVQLAWSQGRAALAGDARITYLLPADGTYFVEMHDQLYRGAAPGFFALKIGELNYADFVLPLAVQRGQAADLLFAGTNLPPATSTHFDGNILAQALPAAWPAVANFTGNRPAVAISDHAELLEQRPADGSLPQAAVPTGISGRLAVAGEDDRYKLAVQPGAALRFDVQAQRIGSPLDGVLTIYNEAGGGLASNDDRPGTTDPGLDFTVPAGVTNILVGLKDLHGRGGEDFVYRISAAPVSQPDFSLTLTEDRQLLPQGGAALLRVQAARTGYNGPIKLSLAGLPAGTTLANDEIPAGANEAFVSLTSSELPLSQGVITVTGQSVDPVVGLVRTARAAETPATRDQPWLRAETGLAVVGPGALVAALAADSAGGQIPIGSPLTIQVQIARAEGMAGPVRLSLLTTQTIPTKAENNQQVPDLARALRVEGTPTIPADQSSVDVVVQVPGDLPEIPYDLAFKAELLSADEKTVVASAVSAARRFPTVKPSFALELTGGNSVAALAGTGETGKLTGRIIRQAGFAQEVTLTLAGLPADYLPPAASVPAGESEFEFPVSFPFRTPPADLAGVKLVGISQLAPNVPLASSNQLDVAVKVTQGGPPPALYRVFEDDAWFAAALNEGDGQATLERIDRLTGTAALRVTQAQKFRANLPSLGVKIAENPGEGEFRYLRFAWKKTSGASLVLQLNANGAWGPAPGVAGPAYRYLAGADMPGMATLKVSDALPHDWIVVTRDLFADFGAFELTGLAFTPQTGDGLFDGIYLARTQDDLAGCPAAIAATEQPRKLFEDEKAFVDFLVEGNATIELFEGEKYSGTASIKVGVDQKYRTNMPGLNLKIRQNPAPGEYRYLRYAWRKQGGAAIALQIGHDNTFGPTAASPAKFRYDAGAGGETYGAALRTGPLPTEGFAVVTRDLYADFGEFTLSGLALSTVDGEYALFDHLYLSRGPRDFELVAPK
ncbi:MAG: hypothetical protein AB7O62_08915 [Pirellulales bacterium]